MIIINGNIYAKNDKEFVSSVFNKGGTAKGFYKIYKNKIIFKDMQGKIFAHLSKNKFNESFLGNASEFEGKIFYQPCCNSSTYIEYFGFGNTSYSELKKSIKELANQLIRSK